MKVLRTDEPERIDHSKVDEHAKESIKNEIIQSSVLQGDPSHDSSRQVIRSETENLMKDHIMITIKSLGDKSS